MNIRALAEADLRTTLEDDVGGFGWCIRVTDPTGVIGNLKGASTDISTVIDPETGLSISGRSASITIRISSLTAKGLGIPKAVVQQSRRPWVITFDDINGKSHTFKVIESQPDRAIGVVVCILEVYSC